MNVTTLYVTAPDREVALKIARDLVGQRLAACANVLGEITSVYWWNSAVQTEPEVALLLKTRPDLISAATERIQKIHPYDCPCVLAWNSSDGSADFSAWVQQETVPPPAPMK